MTISSSQSQVSVAGNGTQTSFQFPFVGDAASDITLTTIASNGAMASISPTNYSVTLNPPASNQLWGMGGTVVYPLVGSPLPSGQSLLIKRILPLTQQISTQNQGNYYSQVTEQALDTLEMQIQQVSTRTSQVRGIWAAGIAYNIGDIVQDGAAGNNTNNYYICVTANTSSVWTTDLNAGDWSISSFAAVPTGALTLLGDVTGAGSSPITTTLATVNTNVGAFTNANITVNAKGLITAAANGSAGSGTVTSVTYTGDGVLQSSTPSSAVTSSGTVAAALLTQAKNTVLAGPTSGSNANPTFRALVAADLPSSSASNLSLTSVASPTATASGTGVMMGLAGSITTNSTGTLQITICGTIQNTAGTDGAKYQIRYGTGAHPNNGDAITGTALGLLKSPIIFQGGEPIPFSTTAGVTGLGAGSTYWIDLSLGAVGGGTVSVQNVDVTVFEVK